jgi:hypothetical protein
MHFVENFLYIGIFNLDFNMFIKSIGILTLYFLAVKRFFKVF